MNDLQQEYTYWEYNNSFSNEEIVEIACAITAELGSRIYERDAIYGGSEYVGEVYQGYGFYIGTYNTRSLRKIAFNDCVVFRDGHKVKVNFEWETPLRELSEKAPIIKLRDNIEEQKKKSLLEKSRQIAIDCHKYLPMETYHSIARNNAGFYVGTYSDDIIDVCDKYSENSYTGTFSYVEIYEKRIREEKHWYGVRKVKERTLVCDGGSLFIDGRWYRYLLDLIEKRKKELDAEADREVQLMMERCAEKIHNIK